MLFAVGFIVDVRDRRPLGHLPRARCRSTSTRRDTYFIVAHIHYVLFGGSIFTIFAGIYYWFPKMTGRMYDERLGKLHFWLTFIGFNLTFFPMHYIGLQGMPRRVADYAPRFADINLFISIASFGLGASTLVFLYNMIHSWALRAGCAEANPWRALTLEWQVSSPPPIFNFDEIPQVVGGPYEYGVPGARHAILGGADPRSGARRGRSRLMAHVLVIANETVASPDAARRRARARRGGDDRVTVIAPVNEPRQGYVVYEDTRRASAGRRLEKTLEGCSARRAFRRRASSSRPARSRPSRTRSSQLEPPRRRDRRLDARRRSAPGWMRRDVVGDIERIAGRSRPARRRRADAPAARRTCS